MRFPQWATPARRAQLLRLFLQSQGRGLCLFGHGADCPCAQAQEELQPFMPQLMAAMMGFPPTDEEQLRIEPLLVRVMAHSYQTLSEEVISDWKGQDRDERATAWRLEQRRFHAAPQLYKRGEFDSIRREQYLADRPVWHIVAIGLNAFTQHRVAQVEIPGLKKVIWVDLSGIKGSKSKLGKLARYQRGAVPKGIVDQVESRIAQAVARFLKMP